MAYEVFISYSHQDQPLRQKLDNHLANLKRQNIITSWYDGEITAGTNWQPQIMQHLNNAQIILLLISDDFMASDFCYSNEMTQAIARHDSNQACVIPIILRPVDWQGAPFEKIQALPTGGKPVTDWLNQDSAFLDIVHGIRKAIDDLTIKGVPANQQRLWNIPYARNFLFTGREDVLKNLSETLKAGKTAALAQPQAISGLGGIGKTQTAVEYAYRHQDTYKAILWVKAESEASINADFVTLASLLDLSEKQAQDQHKIVEAVKRWFLEHADWLLILDNADDVAMVRGFIPLGSKGHILLTTRAHATGGIARRIEVEKMEPDEGALFLLHRAKLLDPDAPFETAPKTVQDTAHEIVKVLDGLPLALDQAGAYIEETACGLQGYWQLYQTQGVRLLEERGGLATDHPDPVATTWSLSFQNVEQANPAAAELLRFCAFLAPDAIPEELFAESASELGPILEPVASDLSSLNTAIRELLKYSLVQRDPEANALSIHRLVQEVLKEEMDEETQRVWAERAVRSVRHVFPNPEYSNWDICRQYLLHAQICSALIEQYNLLFTEAAGLLNRLGYYLWQRGEYEQVESLHQRALTINEEVLGSENSGTATSLVHLGFFYREQERYEQAEPLYLRALDIYEKVLGQDDPWTATSLLNLASLYRNQGKYEQAEPLYQRALAIDEKTYGHDHPDVATDLNNLALLYNNQGKYEQAEPLYQRALAIWEKALGHDHPDVATSLNNLALLYHNQEKYEEAGPLYQRALAICEQALGQNHPTTVKIRNNYADLKERMYEEDI
jgi:tetratricopeptide (TPR) repeat protein